METEGWGNSEVAVSAQAPIPRVLDMVDLSLNTLEREWSVLVDKLGPVMSVSCSEAKDDRLDPDCYGVSLADRVQPADVQDRQPHAPSPDHHWTRGSLRGGLHERPVR